MLFLLGYYAIMNIVSLGDKRCFQLSLLEFINRPLQRTVRSKTHGSSVRSVESRFIPMNFSWKNRIFRFVAEKGKVVEQMGRILNPWQVPDAGCFRKESSRRSREGKAER